MINPCICNPNEFSHIYILILYMIIKCWNRNLKFEYYDLLKWRPKEKNKVDGQVK